MNELRHRGEGLRESGAFLLGRIEHGRREVETFVPYDDLDPRCLDRGIIEFSSEGYTPLYERCEQLGLEVVGDVHTHPGEAFLSDSDRDHPMMSKLGHVALIVPNYAQGTVRPGNLCTNTYLGNRNWDTVNDNASSRRVYVGFWS